VSRSASAAAAQHERKLRRSPGPAVARRVSGPAHRARTVGPQPRVSAAPRPSTGLAGGARAFAGGGAAIASRAAGLALDVSSSRAMDRLVRSRGWIVIVGLGLIGIVAMQVSLLKLNSGIGGSVDAAAALERSNATLRLDISRLTATNRIQRLAAAKGFVMPAPGDVHYSRAGDLESDGRRAARNMRAPQPGAAAQTPSAALPAATQSSSAVAVSGLGAPPTSASTVAPNASQGQPASGIAAPGATPTGRAQPPTTAGPATAGSGTPPPASGGVAPPSSSATTTGP